MAFGAGIHGCVAQMMARMEAEALLSTFARCVASFEETAPRTRRLGLSARGLYSLPVSITPKRGA
jgi:cytochrome P450